MFDEVAGDRRERRVLRYVAQWGPIGQRAIGDDLMLDPGVVGRIVARLLLAGRITIAEHDRHGEPCYVA